MVTSLQQVSPWCQETKSVWLWRASAFWSLQIPRNWLPFHSGWVSEQHHTPGRLHSTFSLVLSLLAQPVPGKYRRWDLTKSSDVFGWVLQAGGGAMRNAPPHLVVWELSWSRRLGWAIPWRSDFFSSAPLILYLCAFFCNLLGKWAEGRRLIKHPLK